MVAAGGTRITPLHGMHQLVRYSITQTGSRSVRFFVSLELLVSESFVVPELRVLWKCNTSMPAGSLERIDVGGFKRDTLVYHNRLKMPIPSGSATFLKIQRKNPWLKFILLNGANMNEMNAEMVAFGQCLLLDRKP